jgi:hypothetical protein
LAVWKVPRQCPLVLLVKDLMNFDFKDVGAAVVGEMQSNFWRAILWQKMFKKLIFGGLHEKHAVQCGIWVPTQHSLWDQGKPRKILIEFAGCRTFRMQTDY